MRTMSAATRQTRRESTHSFCDLVQVQVDKVLRRRLDDQLRRDLRSDAGLSWKPWNWCPWRDGRTRSGTILSSLSMQATAKSRPPLLMSISRRMWISFSSVLRA